MQCFGQISPSLEVNIVCMQVIEWVFPVLSHGGESITIVEKIIRFDLGAYVSIVGLLKAVELRESRGVVRPIVASGCFFNGLVVEIIAAAVLD